MVAYARFETVRALRNPRFLVLVALVPVALYLFGLHSDQGSDGTIEGLPLGVWFLASSAALGTIGAALSGSGARLAAERATGWTRQLRVTPLGDWAWLGGRLLSGLAVVIPVLIVVGVLAATVGDVKLGVTQWAQLAATLLLGSMPISLIGLIIGLVFRAEAAQAAQAVVFVLLLLVGGVFATSSTPPTGLDVVSHVSPSYYILTSARSAVRNVAPSILDVISLAAITLLLGAMVVWLRRRSE